MLVLATGLLVLGVLLFVQKAVKPVVPVVLIVLAIVAGAGALALGGGARPHSHAGRSSATVSIVTPDEGATVSGGTEVTIEVDVQGGRLVQGTTSNDPNAGHLHIFVDGRLQKMTSNASAAVELMPGNHTIVAEFVAADHRSFSPKVLDSILVAAE